jgi:hypothetical protein
MMECVTRRGARTELSWGFAAGSVSMGFMQATPGEIKSLRSSAERIALMVGGTEGCGGGVAAGAIKRWKHNNTTQQPLKMLKCENGARCKRRQKQKKREQADAVTSEARRSCQTSFSVSSPPVPGLRPID